MKFKHGPNKYIEIDSQTMAIEIFTKGERFLCYFDREDYPRIKNFRWSITSTSKRNATRYLRTHPWRVGPSEGWTMMLHQLIMSFPTNGQIDHINHEGFDNRKSNLRVVSKLENARNKHYKHKAKSGYYGVVPNASKKNPWKVYVSHFKKSIYVGAFATKEDAALAHDQKVVELRGDFAILNFPNHKTNSKCGKSAKLKSRPSLILISRSSAAASIARHMTSNSFRSTQSIVLGFLSGSGTTSTARLGFLLCFDFGNCSFDFFSANALF